MFDIIRIYVFFVKNVTSISFFSLSKVSLRAIPII